MDEKLWEEYADLSKHEAFFAVHQLLYETFEGTFPNPEALLFEVRIQETTKHGLPIFESVPEAPLVRLSVGSLPKNTVLNRLFNEKIEGESFTEAQDILWQLNLVKQSADTLTATIVSSHYWFKDLKYVDTYEAETHLDS